MTTPAPAKRTRPKPSSPHSDPRAAVLRRIRTEHLRETAQDYAEAIAELLAENGEVRVVDLARRLGVSHVTVVRSLSRLRRDGLVSAKPYRSIFLTEAGRALAEESRRRHEVLLEFLRSLGLPEEVVQHDAEGMEHHVSPETVAAFKRFIAERSRTAPAPAQRPEGRE